MKSLPTQSDYFLTYIDKLRKFQLSSRRKQWNQHEFVNYDQNNSYEITINGFQVRKINEIRNVI